MANSDKENLSIKNEEVALKREELALKKDEVEFKKKEAEHHRRFEKWRTWGNMASVIVAALALAIPVWIAAINVRAERILAEEQASLTFQMKVADLAFANVRKAEQAKVRALALAKLFSPNKLLPDEFAQDFNPKDFKLDQGGSINRREQILALIAKYPDQRQQILKDWYVFFHWDQWWVEPMLEVTVDEKNKLDKLSEWLCNNEKNLIE